MKITIYSPESGVRNPVKLIQGLFQDFTSAHNLGIRLAKRNVKALYRQSLLGYFWSVLPPLVTSVVWIFLNGSRVINIEDPGVPYPLFVLIGTMLWQVFSESVQAPLKGVNSGRSMLAKINFPRESLILAGIYEAFFNTFIKIVLIIIIFILFNYMPSLNAFIALIGILAMIILGSCIGILLTPLGMLYKDIQRGLTLVLQFALYLTPVIYPEPRFGPAEKFMQFNPVAPLLSTTRNLLLNQPLVQLNQFLIICIISLALFVLGIIFYRIASPIIIERVGS